MHHTTFNIAPAAGTIIFGLVICISGLLPKARAGGKPRGISPYDAPPRELLSGITVVLVGLGVILWGVTLLP